MEERIKTIILALCFGIFTTVFLMGPTALLHERMERWKFANFVFSPYTCLFIGGFITGLIMGIAWPGRGAWGYLICVLVSPGLYWSSLLLLQAQSPGEDPTPKLRVALWIILPLLSALFSMAIIQCKADFILNVIGRLSKRSIKSE